MGEVRTPPQPGSPERAHRLLPLGRLGASLLFGAIFCVAATIGFVWLADAVFANRFVGIDDGIIAWTYGYRASALDQLMLFVTTLGETLVLALFVGLVALALLRRDRWIDAAGLIVASVGAGILNQVLKEVYQRARPDLFPGPFHLTSYSFPSGHAMGSIVCYGMLAFLGVRLLRRRAYKAALVLATTILVLGVGLSRVYFGVHFPTDILGGFTAGAIWLVIMIGVVRAAEWYARRRARRDSSRGISTFER